MAHRIADHGSDFLSLATEALVNGVAVAYPSCGCHLKARLVEQETDETGESETAIIMFRLEVPHGD